MQFTATYGDDGKIASISVDEWETETDIDHRVMASHDERFMYIYSGFLYILAGNEKARYRIISIGESSSRWLLVKVNDVTVNDD